MQALHFIIFLCTDLQYSVIMEMILKKEKVFLMNTEIKLNFEYYPLVVGQLDKYTFSDWEVEGGNILLEAFITGSDYSALDVIWTSSDERIATVDKGKVHALRTGVTDICAKLPNGNCAKCVIQVIDNPGRLTTFYVTLNTDRLVLNKSEGAVLHTNVLPVDYFNDGRRNPDFTWTSQDENVAVVNDKGHIFAKNVGKTIITAVSNDIGRGVSCEVEVIKKTAEQILADPLEDFDKGKYRVIAGDKIKLKLPKEVENQPVYWCSENESKASVDADGVVTTYSRGIVNIWATFINGGFRTKYQLRINKPKEAAVEKVVFNKKIINMAVNEQTTITGTVFPATLLDKSLLWCSSDESVVRVVNQRINLSGIDEVTIEAVGQGEALITGACEDKATECTVVVQKNKAYIDMLILPAEREIESQQVDIITPAFNKNAIYTDVMWISDNREVVTVDKDGVIKGYNEGEANVFCISINNMEEEDFYALAAFADMRNVSSDEQSLRQMKEILEKNIFDFCKVLVKKDNKYIYNLQAPKEAVTDKSICLLWNCDSRGECEDLKEYQVFVDGKLIKCTDMISYTIKNLEPDTKYEIVVKAVDYAGNILAQHSVSTKTKEASNVILDVTKPPYNAVGNGIITDTIAIQRAIDDCPFNGTVLLPQGYVFLSGALFLKSDMTFVVDGILFGSDDPADYPHVVCRWEGYRKLKLTRYNEITTRAVFKENVYSHSSLINVGVYDESKPGQTGPYTTKNVNICGKGMINGNGFTLAHNEGPCWYIYRKGLPIPQSPKRDQNIRGRVLAFYNTKNAYVSDVTVAYGPSWTIHPVFSDSITFDNVKVISMGNGRTGVMEGMLILNGDGIDPDSCTNINITNCYFTVGDDAVAIKSGRNRQGNELAKPSAYIRVTDCKCIDAKGAFCIGSEQAGGAHDILFQNLLVRDILHFGLWIKSAACRGGLVEDVLFRDCILENTGGALQIEYNHGGDEDPSLVLPLTRQITYENITFAGKNKFGVRVIGIPDSPIYNVDFKNCHFTESFVAKKDRKFYLSNCYDIDVSGLKLPDGYEWECE